MLIIFVQEDSMSGSYVSNVRRDVLSGSENFQFSMQEQSSLTLFAKYQKHQFRKIQKIQKFIQILKSKNTNKALSSCQWSDSVIYHTCRHKE